ncbi:hypothetical protein TNCT_316011 [Trichonephila clavata]|uniref:Uncharacterized protein n=1 Tax=Trichonephila clavata TaxID=2740835 RepID=A0A8X6M3S2_TRICU|nr:hypothetical protein TNCT_316011 [Trichonephila clavata]
MRLAVVLTRDGPLVTFWAHFLLPLPQHYTPMTERFSSLFPYPVVKSLLYKPGLLCNRLPKYPAPNQSTQFRVVPEREHFEALLECCAPFPSFTLCWERAATVPNADDPTFAKSPGMNPFEARLVSTTNDNILHAMCMLTTSLRALLFAVENTLG